MTMTANPDAGQSPIVLYSRALQAYTLQLWTETLRKTEEEEQKRRSLVVARKDSGPIGVKVKRPPPTAHS
uniref:Uncharacterized protein n=1 Tax=Mycena chlorophos TaxID=658473 RepID=A0ABQ0L574_MYCCL|nr:predicted protein [Mycena chlorophos]